MNRHSLQQALAASPVRALRYYHRIDSTNDEALRWAQEGAPDWSLVVADAQTRGRGRNGRRWHTPPGSALALSFLWRLPPNAQPHISQLSGLAAVALRAALATFGYQTAIKWPNDLLLQGKKVAGILVEAQWLGQQAEAVVLGIGLNVRRAALPPAETLTFPAISLEDWSPPPHRPALVRALAESLASWRPQLGSQALLSAWEAALAWRGEQVQIAAMRGRLLGLAPDGRLRLQTPDGAVRLLAATEGHLRPEEI